MQKERKFLICETCGNLVGMIHDAGVPMLCCGKSMEELLANTSEGASEKHVPLVEKDGVNVTVKVGSIYHPMTSEHSIDWVYLQTKKGGQRKKLAQNEEPVAHFVVTKDDCPVMAYAYCNLHGFWKSADIQ